MMFQIFLKHIDIFLSTVYFFNDFRDNKFFRKAWDSVLAVKAILSCNLSEVYGETIRKAHEFLKASQVRENLPDNFSVMDRHISKGSWTFSAQDQGCQSLIVQLKGYR